MVWEDWVKKFKEYLRNLRLETKILTPFKPLIRLYKPFQRTKGLPAHIWEACL